MPNNRKNWNKKQLRKQSLLAVAAGQSVESLSSRARRQIEIAQNKAETEARQAEKEAKNATVRWFNDLVNSNPERLHQREHGSASVGIARALQMRRLRKPHIWYSPLSDKLNTFIIGNRTDVQRGIDPPMVTATMTHGYVILRGVPYWVLFSLDIQSAFDRITHNDYDANTMPIGYICSLEQWGIICEIYPDFADFTLYDYSGVTMSSLISGGYSEKQAIDLLTTLLA